MKPGDNGSEDAAENTYDTASGPSGSRTKPSKGDAPVVYSAVDKENRQGRPVSYAFSLYWLAQITCDQ